MVSYCHESPPVYLSMYGRSSVSADIAISIENCKEGIDIRGVLVLCCIFFVHLPTLIYFAGRRPPYCERLQDRR